MDETKTKPVVAVDLEAKIPPGHGYKIVDRNLQGLNGFQYAVGQTATTGGKLEICVNGLHYCYAAHDCIAYTRTLRPPYRYLRVIPKSDIVTGTDKAATLNLFVEAEIPATEWLAQVRKEFKSRLNNNANWLLMAGVIEGDMTTMDLALDCWRLARDDWRFHAAAAESGRIDTMQYLFSRGITNCEMALEYAVRGQQLPVIKFVMAIREGYKPSEFEIGNAIVTALSAVSTEIVDALIAEVPTRALAALRYAASFNKLDMMKFLLKKVPNGIYEAALAALPTDLIMLYLVSLPTFSLAEATKLATARNDDKAKFFTELATFR